ncbi:ethanolamine ammonia-lyase [Pollutimonas subterranea]|uniref:Ethanolamine ammonia-lyase small subunit n=1 Tax=Pollutimonas subterranea TaxID=2045210 RepID=A0A2N4U505_9BURK|nr:ethanolamine ammonia-lyase subunit EutC [Pollutimonas subterranea]PLC50092.1 ethanolamine ammonia-lyase [Pollutimonas subterranea]
MSNTPVDEDPWTDLQQYTRARLALGRAGNSIPTAEVLRFGYAHAQARVAVHTALDVDAMRAALERDGLTAVGVQSAAPDRATYLARPDLGRQLAPDSAMVLRDYAGGRGGRQDDVACDLLLIVADGLSSTAISRHARPLVSEIVGRAPADWVLGPVVIATQARVALGDEIGEILGARMSVMLIGERPGLSSPDSLGMYLTWGPHRGCTDAQRNCISNVRPEGLAYREAARRLWWLCTEARRLQLTGIALKDGSDVTELTSDLPQSSRDSLSN